MRIVFGSGVLYNSFLVLFSFLFLDIGFITLCVNNGCGCGCFLCFLERPVAEGAGERGNSGDDCRRSSTTVY